MKFVSVRDLRGNSGEIWRSLPAEREMVITNNGRPIAILSSVGETNVEATLASIRRARATDAVAELQRRAAAAPARPTSDDVELEIAEARKARRR
jgi:antitoxin (DNA-binding transcriptional repressor) of toxin-antitoxin stability system